jgi:hypothetical protein
MTNAPVVANAQRLAHLTISRLKTINQFGITTALIVWRAFHIAPQMPLNTVRKQLANRDINVKDR